MRDSFAGLMIHYAGSDGFRVSLDDLLGLIRFGLIPKDLSPCDISSAQTFLDVVVP